MRTRSAVLLFAALALAACADPVPEKATIVIDRGDAGIEFGEVSRDAKVEQSLSIGNDGLDDLAITAVASAGAGEFTLSGPTPKGDAGTNAALVPYGKHTFLKVAFYPRAYKDYAGTITITSNAANKPMLVVPVSGRGIDAGM